jgi:hypothetical protein
MLTVSTSAAVTSTLRPDQTSMAGGDGASTPEAPTFTHTPAATCSPNETAMATATLGRATLNNDTVKRTVFPRPRFHQEKRSPPDAPAPVSVPTHSHPVAREATTAVAGPRSENSITADAGTVPESFAWKRSVD